MRQEQRPTSEELEAVRQKLVQQIDEAQQLFDTSHNGHELLTSKAALKIIKQLLTQQKRGKQEPEKLDVA